MGVAATGGRAVGPGEDDRDRRDDVGSQRGVAEHRAARHGRELRGVSDAAGRGVGHHDADPGRPGAVG